MRRRSSLAAGHRGHRLGAGVDGFEYAQCLGQQLLAGGGEPLHAAPAGAAALHQPGAGKFLQLGEGLGHGGLAQRQPLGGAGQVALLRHGDEAAQVPQLHVARKCQGRGGGRFLQLPAVMQMVRLFNLHHQMPL